MNGNVIAYLDPSGEPVARFEYDPFGNLTVGTEQNAYDFPFRFSTKPQDLATGLYYYGYRWYDPLTGRWPSRDPVEEQGGLNLYGFVGNDGVGKTDVFGLALSLGYTTNDIILNEFGIQWKTTWTLEGLVLSTSEDDRKKLARDPMAGYAREGEIVQVVTTTGHRTDCKTGETQDVSNELTEYWAVSSNFGISIMERDGHDSFDVDPMVCTKGAVIMHGYATFVHGYTRPMAAVPGGNPQSGSLESVPAIVAIPAKNDASNMVQKVFIVEWDWCDVDNHVLVYQIF